MTLSDLANYSMTRSVAESATAELLVLSADIDVFYIIILSYTQYIRAFVIVHGQTRYRYHQRCKSSIVPNYLLHQNK